MTDENRLIYDKMKTEKPERVKMIRNMIFQYDFDIIQVLSAFESDEDGEMDEIRAVAEYIKGLEQVDQASGAVN